MTMYIVRGGCYTDETFKTLVEGKQEYYGPFCDYGHALTEWRRHTFGPQIDDCHHRLVIEEFNEPDFQKFRYFKHEKRKTHYALIANVEVDEYFEEGDELLYYTPLSILVVPIQRSVSKQMSPISIYMSMETFKLYGRPTEEFFDGRFTEVD